MKIHFKILQSLISSIRVDLRRPHPFAAERVGFISCRVAEIHRGVLILGESYFPVADEDYVDDATVGAMMGPTAIRKALQFAYGERVCMFHVHMHEHSGRPWFSGIDLRENAKFVPDFWNVRPEFPHGVLVLSLDSASGLCWNSRGKKTLRIDEFVVVGTPMSFTRGGRR